MDFLVNKSESAGPKDNNDSNKMKDDYDSGRKRELFSRITIVQAGRNLTAGEKRTRKLLKRCHLKACGMTGVRRFLDMYHATSQRQYGQLQPQ